MDEASYDVSASGLSVVQGLAALTDSSPPAPGDQPVGQHVINVIVTADPDLDDRARVRSKQLSVTADRWRISARVVVPSRAT